MVNNLKGGGFESPFGDNKPQFYHVKSIRGGANPVDVHQKNYLQLKKQYDAQANLDRLLAQDEAYNKFNYSEEEAKCATAKNNAKKHMQTQEMEENAMVEKM